MREQTARNVRSLPHRCGSKRELDALVPAHRRKQEVTRIEALWLARLVGSELAANRVQLGILL